MAVGETGLAFLQKEATVDDRGVSHVTQKKYLEYMAQNGVTSDVVKAYTSAHEELVNGAYLYAAGRLTDQVEEAKKAGRNPFAEKASIGINIPNGSIDLTITAAKTYPIPKKPGETVTRTMVGNLDIRQQRLMDKGICAAAEEEMRKQLGI